MRIALVTEFFHPSIGGTQTVVAAIARELATRGHEVIVIAPASGRRTRPAERRGTLGRPKWGSTGGSEHADDEGAPDDELFGVSLIAVPRTHAVSYAWVQRGVWRRLRSDLEVVHVFHPSFGLAGLVARRTRQTRLIVSLMGYDTYDFANMARVKRVITRAVCRGADVVTAPSHSLARVARGTGIRRDIRHIPHGVTRLASDPSHVEQLRERFPHAHDTTTFVAIQRMYPVKDPGALLEAWRRLGRQDCLLLLVGGGELERAMRKRACQLGLDNVRLVGEVGRDAVPSYLALADAFIHHAQYESFGMGVLEAMEAGLPVIASKVGALPEIITHGVDGLLIPPADPDALADAVARLADSPELRSQLAAAARRRAQDFGWHTLIDRYEEVYRED